MKRRLDRQSPWDDPKLLKRKRIIGIASVAAVLIVLIVLTIILGKPIANAIRDKAGFRQWMQGTGFWKYPLMIGIMALQVVIAFIPGEPIEIIAGYVFGSWMGLLLCLLGTALGSVIIILAVRRFGMKLVTLFIQKEHLENLRFFKDTKKRDATIFLLFLIPGTPKDILTYLAGLVPIHLGKYLLLTSIARIPSVITSTMGGNKLGTRQYGQAIIIFAVTLVLTAVAALVYQQYQKKRPKEDGEEGEAVQKDESSAANGKEDAPALAGARVDSSSIPAGDEKPAGGEPAAAETPVPVSGQSEPAPENNEEAGGGLTQEPLPASGSTKNTPEETNHVPAQ